MKVETYLLASSLLRVLAQRLVRTLCPACRTAQAPSEEGKLLAELGLPATQPVWTAAGCPECNRTGFRGRTGVYELIVIDDVAPARSRRRRRAGAARCRGARRDAQPARRRRTLDRRRHDVPRRARAGDAGRMSAAGETAGRAEARARRHAIASRPTTRRAHRGRARRPRHERGGRDRGQARRARRRAIASRPTTRRAHRGRARGGRGMSAAGETAGRAETSTTSPTLLPRAGEGSRVRSSPRSGEEMEVRWARRRAIASRPTTWRAHGGVAAEAEA